MRTVYGKGLNIAGQINRSRQNFKSFTPIQQLQQYNIRSLGCGYLQSYYLLDDGQILKSGYYMDSLTSIRVLNLYRLFPWFLRFFQKFPILGRIASFKGGDQNLTLINKKQLQNGLKFESAVFSHSGINAVFEDKMYCIGQNYFGQRGTSDLITHEYSMRQVDKIDTFQKGKNRFQPIKDVGCGFQHSIIITKEGDAYGCGKADSFQIQPYKYYHDSQITTVQKIQFPTLIWGKTKVLKVACGYKHSILLTEDNKIMALGSNLYGQCGLNNLNTKQLYKITEVKVPLQKNEVIKDIKCGFNHTLILTNMNTFFMGSIELNQNPFASKKQIIVEFQENICSPTIMELPSLPVKIFANFDRSGIITEDGKLYIFGGRDLSKRGGESGKLDIIDDFKFSTESEVGLGFSHTLIYP